jgi:hypothetical protein
LDDGGDPPILRDRHTIVNADDAAIAGYGDTLLVEGPQTAHAQRRIGDDDRADTLLSK